MLNADSAEEPCAGADGLAFSANSKPFCWQLRRTVGWLLDAFLFSRQSVGVHSGAQRTCIFCNGTRLSKEHVWANWIRNHVERSFSNSEHFVQNRRRGLGEHRVSETRTEGKLHNNGDPASRKLRVVCEDCNNGWMSDLQRKAQPILTPMLTGKQWILDHEAQKVLAAWGTMFTLVYEAGVPGASAMHDEDRKKFAMIGSPPGNWLIFVGTYAGSLWRTRIESYSSLVNRTYGSPFHPPTTPRVNTAATTAVIGTFLLHTFYSYDFPLFFIDENFCRTFKLQRIWPANTAALESRCEIVDDSLAARIAGCFREVDSMGYQRQTLTYRTLNRGSNQR